MSKRILVVRYANYLADARTRREAETLTARGDEVDFIGLAEGNHPKEETLNGVRALRLPLVQYRGGSRIRYVVSYMEFFIRVFLKSTFLHMKKHYDVIHIHTMPDFMVFTALLPKLLGAKVVLDVHDMMPELYMSKFGLSETHLLVRLLKIQEKASILFADRVICVHDPHKSILQSRIPNIGRITVLFNVPDPAIFGTPVVPLSSSAEFPRFVFHGTVAERLGLDIALEAFSKVIRVIPNAKMEIYGDGDYTPRIEEMIVELELQKSVFFSKKFFKVEEIPKLLSGAIAGIIPNRRDRATEYMLPVKLLEYAYLGIPAVAPRFTAIQYYFSDDSLGYYDPGNVSQLAGLLIDLWSDPIRRQRMAVRAQEQVCRMSWESMRPLLFDVVDR